MSFFLFILVVGLLLFNVSLNNRVNKLEQKFKDKTATGMLTSVPPAPPSNAHEAGTVLTPMPPAEEGLQIPVPVPAFGSQSQNFAPASSLSGQQKESSFVGWFKEQTLIKIGSIIFFLGAVWFVSYAIEQNWISPIMRILLGVLLGLGAYALAYMRSTKDRTQYQVITVLGTGIILGSVVASQFSFAEPIIPALVAMLGMVTALVYTVYVALQTNTEWIGSVSALAGFLVPFLVVTEEPSAHGLLAYGFLLSVSLLTVAFRTAWRNVTIISLLGASLYLYLVAGSNALDGMTTWLYASVFSLLFFGATTVSLWRTRNPIMLDASIVGLLGLQFISYSVAYIAEPALAVFVASALVAVTGYVLRERGAGEQVVLLYAALASVGIVVATTLQFAGFVLTVAYALEILMVYAVALRLGKTEKSVFITGALFALPVLSGLNDIAQLSYNESALSARLVGVVAVVVALGVAWYLSVTYKREENKSVVRKMVPVFAVVGYLFFITAAYTIADMYAAVIRSEASMLMVSMLVGMVVLLALLVQSRNKTYHQLGLLTLVLPTILALDVVLSDGSVMSLSSHAFYASLVYIIGLGVLTVRYWGEAIAEQSVQFFGAIAYGLTWLTMFFVAVFLSDLWSTLLPDGIDNALISLTWLVVPYVAINTLLWLKQEASRVVPVLYVLVIPLVLFLGLYDFNGWSDGVFAVDAIVLYVAATIVTLLAKTLYDHGSAFKNATNVLAVIAGIKIFALVWMISQSLFSYEAIAVTIALIVYTVVGLGFYVHGQISEKTMWRRAGMYLLIAVVLRLFLVDFWVMEQVWQIVTFLGVGALFIAAALYETSKRSTQEEGKIIGD